MTPKPETKFTKGPWQHKLTTRPGNGTKWRDIVAVGEFGEMYIGEALGYDADLIAAAPELYKSLEKVLHETGTECYCNVEEQYFCGRCMAQAALAKARGEK
jgi:hypothetical protein